MTELIAHGIRSHLGRSGPLRGCALHSRLAVVSMVAEGQTYEEIVAELPELELEDIREALRYAAEAVRERELPLLSHSS